jgi:transcriptional regulator
VLANKIYDIEAVEDVRRLISRHGWAMLSSDGGGSSPIISHLPIVLDPQENDVTVLGHVARVDAEEHRLGEVEGVLVVQGPEAYVSPTLYGDTGPFVPTWNFIAIHLHGTPTVLDEEETWQVLEQTVDHFESRFEKPWQLDSVREYAESLVPHVTGFRLRATRVVTKAKVSQDKPHAVIERIIEGFASDGPYQDAAMAAAMREFGTPR